MEFCFNEYSHDQEIDDVLDRLWDIQDNLDGFQEKDLTKIPWGFTVSHDDEIIGAVSGHIKMNWMYIRNLILDPKYRNNGLGKSLMDRAENLAISQNLAGIYLKTFSFQAPDFYKKCGFKIIGSLNDMPKGHANHFMMKEL